MSTEIYPEKKKFEKFKHMQLSCLAKIYYFSTRFNQPKNSRTCSHTIEWIKRKANRFLTCQCPPRTIFRNEANNFYIFSYIELRSMMNAHASNAGSTKRLSQYHQLIAIFKLNAIYSFFSFTATSVQFTLKRQEAIYRNW